MAASLDTSAMAERLGALLTERAEHAAVAESLTGGGLTNQLAAVEGSSRWLRGGVVAYDADVKYRVLQVREGPVVAEAAVMDMAAGVARLLDAELAIAVSGVAGPAPLEGHPPGTVWVAVGYGDAVVAHQCHFEGDPIAVCLKTAAHAVTTAVSLLEGTSPAPVHDTVDLPSSGEGTGMDPAGVG